MAEICLKSVIAVILLFCGIMDFYRKKIYLWMPVTGGLLAAVCIFFCKDISLMDRLAGAAVGAGVMLLSYISGGKIGMGDGIVLCITGLGLGFWGNMELFCLALMLAAERVMKDQRGNVESYSSLEEARKLLAERAATERKRYKEIYNLNYMDFNNYNLVIDSTFSPPELIARIIYEEAKNFYKDNAGFGATRLLLPPARLIGPDCITEADKERLQALIQKYKQAEYKIDDIIEVKNADGDYEPVANLDKVKAAFLAGIPYIQVRLVKKESDSI